ncbi:MAG: serine/threonine protein kinase [bacterium]|nr:serine/threonine protein kinase [bacterium]
MKNTGMDADRWQRIEGLFHVALDLPDHQRADYLAAQCPNADLRADVDRLLTAHARTAGFLRDKPTDDDAYPEMKIVGRRIGLYRLVEFIDSGGSGAVYRAVRADREFEQQVAVKLVNRWMVTPLVRRRFLRERQTLADLEHPGITRLLDGGTTDDGIPYLVMEYVPGTRVDRYCSDHVLTVPERLDLFSRICDIVAYAHRNLVVHRDLKPGNIFVTDDGRPKLLDFGIAKLLALPPGSAATTQTLQQMRALTPRYASPEQIRGESITTASDVYSLGVVLYELLTGRPPYRLSARSSYEAERTVCETEPEIPSHAVMKTPDPEEDEADTTRGFPPPESPVRLRSRLKGDLDAIVLKALHKDPADRYGSVTELADDLARHIHGQPVKAHRQSAGYRAAKFVHRNRVAMAAATIVLLVLIAGGVATSLALVREGRAHRLASSEAAQAGAINSFLNEMLSSVDPSRDGRDVRVAAILDRAADDVGSRFDEQPEVTATLRTTIGRSYRALGMLESAAAQLEHALRLREDLLGPSHVATLESLNELGVLRVMQGDFPAADTILQRALRTCQSDLGPDHDHTRSVLSTLAGLRNAQGRSAEAEALLRRLLAAQRRALGETHPESIRTIHNLGLVLYSMQKEEQATWYLRRAVSLHSQVHGPDHIHTIRAKGNLGVLHQGRGELAEAEPLLLDALDGGRRLLSDQHPETMSFLHNVAVLRQRQGRHAEALTLARETLQIAEESLPAGHLKVARFRDHFGACLVDVGRFAKAEEALLDAYETLSSQLESGHPWVQNALSNLVALYEAYGKPEQAAIWQSKLAPSEEETRPAPKP